MSAYEVAMMRLLDEKDAQIKALADALWNVGWVVDSGEWHYRHCPQGLPPAAAPCTCEDKRAALKAVGRL